MKKATKKQMVDFIHTYMLMDGKHPTKKLLNEQDYETLEKIINRKPDRKGLFEKYCISV